MPRSPRRTPLKLSPQQARDLPLFPPEDGLDAQAVPFEDKRAYTVLFPFCGLGAGALGFLQAQHPTVRFRVLGGIDFDALACQDFERLTKAPAWCVDITKIDPKELRARYGEAAPDVVFFSPPCKGASGLLSKKAANSKKYQDMNELALLWCQLMLAAWALDKPRLLLLENVPRLTKRAPKMLARLKELLEASGYLVSQGYHDCGEIGGLAQHRRRFLLVARHKRSVGHYLYEPPKLRVKGCGEVLGLLPLPGDPAAGPMHRLPKISWLNWVRLALIPAGGDWRDLPGVVPQGQRRGAVWKRHRVEPWEEPVGTVAGSGSNGVANVADPRFALGYATRPGTYGVASWYAPVPAITGQSGRPGHCSGGAVADPLERLSPLDVTRAYPHSYGVLRWSQPAWTIATETSTGCGAYAVADARLFDGLALPASEGRHWNKYRVGAWAEPAGTVMGAVQVGSGAPSVADPRLSELVGLACLGASTHTNLWRVGEWARPVGTVTGATRPGQGAISIADPRIAYHHGSYGVVDWDRPAATVTSGAGVSTGPHSVADPRASYFPGSYGVMSWATPAGTVTGEAAVSTGPHSVADPRLRCTPRAGAYRVLSWLEAAATVTGSASIDNGPFAVADPRKPPAEPIVIIAADGTWHRPLTTLELAVLQGLPWLVDGEPLVLSGGSSVQREHIGNAVPVQAAQAIAEQMLRTLYAADNNTLFFDAKIWVAPPEPSLSELPQ
jgi:site-specific DNA-cytosine methylase